MKAHEKSGFIRLTMLSTVLLAVLFALQLAGCPPDEHITGGCLDDAECIERYGPGFYCSDRYSPRVCLCSTDSACGPGEFCNDAGVCQASVGCYTNADCPEDSFCDVVRNKCIQEKRCTSDIHCPIGEVCNELTHRCTRGCRESGDCPLGQACRCPDGSDECEIGRCEYGICDDSSFCPYGWICEHDEEEGDSVCRVDDRGPYCQHCEYGPGGHPPCGDWANRCLVDTAAHGQTNFCGVDCSQGQPCPSGFRCAYIVLLTQALCYDEENHSDCEPTGGPCETDDDCPGGRCDEASGRCGGKCVIHEGHSVGWCTCVQDSDCPVDTCDPMTRRCGLTHEPCQLEGGDHECRGQLTCINLYGRGGCVVGRNCAPQEGISCAEVRELR